MGICGVIGGGGSLWIYGGGGDLDGAKGGEGWIEDRVGWGEMKNNCD